MKGATSTRAVARVVSRAEVLRQPGRRWSTQWNTGHTVVARIAAQSTAERKGRSTRKQPTMRKPRAAKPRMRSERKGCMDRISRKAWSKRCSKRKDAVPGRTASDGYANKSA